MEVFTAIGVVVSIACAIGMVGIGIACLVGALKEWLQAKRDLAEMVGRCMARQVSLVGAYRKLDERVNALEGLCAQEEGVEI